MQREYTITGITTSTTTTIVGSAQRLTIHTICFPIATAGTVTLKNSAGTGYTSLVFPIGSIGSHVLDVAISSGLLVTTSAADTLFVTWTQ